MHQRILLPLALFVLVLIGTMTWILDHETNDQNETKFFTPTNTITYDQQQNNSDTVQDAIPVESVSPEILGE